MPSTPPEQPTSPTLLTACDERLPVSVEPQRIGYSQLLLFRASDAEADQFRLPVGAPAVDAAQQKRWAASLSARLLSEVPVARPAGAPKVNVLDTVRAKLARHFPELRLPEQLRSEDELRELLASLLQPAATAPLEADEVHLGLCAEFEQRWTPTGYTRGELLQTISLAPGEQVTLEYHSWDKTTRRSEQELLDESEQHLSRKLTQRDSADVVSEIARQSGKKLTTGFGLSLPVSPGAATVNASANASNEVSEALSDTLKATTSQVTEQVQEAASSLKSQRKLRIEIARDVGHEEKQTRVIANSNRGHTLNCHYFEILANYRIETALLRLRPCLLVPMPRERVTRRWLLLHEDVLRQALLDPLFLAGFEAAKLLEVCARFDALADATASMPADVDNAALSALRQTVISAWRALDSACEHVLDAIADPHCQLARLGGPVTYLGVLALEAGGTRPLRRALARMAIAADDGVVDAFERLLGEPADTPARVSLQRLLDAIGPQGLDLNLDAASVATGMRALGLPWGAVTLLLAAGGLLGMGADDAGLATALAHAQAALANSRSTQGSGAARVEGNTGYPGSKGQVEEAYTRLQRANAEVEYERLRAHIESQWQHYQQALWLHLHPDARAAYLRGYGAVTSAIAEPMLGFHGHSVVYPLRSAALLQPLGISAATLVQLSKDAAAVPAPFALALPTGGALLEAHLGECDACESYILESRELELAQRRAELRQANAEADRREQRLRASPPDLAEFAPSAPPELAVTLRQPPDAR